MDALDLYKRLEHFLKNEPACQQTLGCLSENAEISLIIGGSMTLCAHFLPDGVHLKEASCRSPDFVFRASPQAVETMISETGLSAAELGIKLVKQFFADQIDLEMHGHFLHVLRKGYLQIVRVGGIEFLQGLRQYNLASVTKIVAFLKSLRPSA